MRLALYARLVLGFLMEIALKENQLFLPSGETWRWLVGSTHP
jgi:hypothetical protein